VSGDVSSASDASPPEPGAALDCADIVVGVPTYNNARTIAHVVRAIHTGLCKYFPQFSAVIVNSDGGSTDDTRDILMSSRVGGVPILMLSTPMFPVHRLSLPYHGIPGKGSAFRLIFQMAEKLRASACIVIDADLRSVTPEWVDLLLRPIIYAGYDLVTPHYHRHKYDGTITSSIVYPLTRALYGRRVRQPIGGDFGVSGRLISRYLQRGDWDDNVARYDVDLWMTTIAVAEGYRVCQSFLGENIHATRDPGADLSTMLQQVVGSVFSLMQEYENVWLARSGSESVDLFGFRRDAALDQIPINLPRMLQAFQRGCAELGEVWEMALTDDTLRKVRRLVADSHFHMNDDLWARVIYDFACAYKERPLERGHLLRSLAPLYLGRLASFMIETQDLYSAGVDEKIEQLCVTFEDLKPYLISRWTGRKPAEPQNRTKMGQELGVEVKS